MTRLVSKGGKLLTRDGKLTTCETACCCPAGQTQRTPSVECGDWNDVPFIDNPANAYGCANDWRGVKLSDFEIIADGATPDTYFINFTNFPLSTFDYFDAAAPSPGVTVTSDSPAVGTQLRTRGRIHFYTKKSINISYAIVGANIRFTVALTATWHFIFYHVTASNFKVFTKGSDVLGLGVGSGRVTNHYEDYYLVHQVAVDVNAISFPAPYVKQTATWPPDFNPFELRNKNHSCYFVPAPCWYPRGSASWKVDPLDPYETIFSCPRWEFATTSSGTFPANSCPVWSPAANSDHSYAETVSGLFTDYRPREDRCGNPTATTVDGALVSCPRPATLPNTSSEVGAGGGVSTFGQTVLSTTSVLTRRGPAASANTTISRTYQADFDKTDFLNGVVDDYVINVATQDGDLRTISGVATIGNVGINQAGVTTVNWGPKNLPNLPASVTVTI
jgi:hypothetical protein